MKKKHKTYSRPKRPFDKQRLEEEAKIKKDFGLKNKKELWKANARIKSMREKAKKIITAKPEEQKALFSRLQKIGLNVNSISDVLSLETTDYLKRRLQTILVEKKLANTTKMARQLITHKKVLVGKNIVNVPSFIVSVELENKISLKKSNKKVVKKSKEILEGNLKEEALVIVETPKEEVSDKKEKDVKEELKKEIKDE